MIKGFVTTEEAAKRLGISATRVRQMIITGVIKDTDKIGKSHIIPEKEMKRLEALDRKAGRPALPKKEPRRKNAGII